MRESNCRRWRVAAAEAGWAGRMWVEVVEAWCIVELADDSGR